MKINWFPGHMTKALRMMEVELKLADFVLYVLDSRAPFSSLNPSLAAILKDKPIIYVLNKADLADDGMTRAWAKRLEGDNSKTIVLNSTESGSAKIIKKKLKELSIKKIEKNIRRGINIPVRALVVGVPNSGKSTLTNNLCNKGKTITGDKPGVTKGKQWVRIDDHLELCDTPGTLWPNLESYEISHNLLYIGSIKDTIVVIEEIGFDFIKKLMELDRSIIEKRYGVDTTDKETIEIYDEIAMKRGFVLKNKEIDYERCARALLDDFRKGRLGKITLDRDFSMSRESSDEE